MSSTYESIGEYLKERYRLRRKLAIDFLGGKCIKCGSLERLELDHIDSRSKDFDISRFWGTTLVRFWAEVKKCQLLCKPCHSKKTILERGLKFTQGRHGTITTYKNCRCEQCRKARRVYMKKYRETHQRKG